MLALNRHLFLLVNAHPGASPAIVAVAEIIASDLIGFVPLLLVALWIWGEPERRAGLAATAAATVLALGANQVAGLLWYEPRPFMVGLGRTLMAHPADNSFPSDHATFMLTIGFALVVTRAAPTWGKIVCVLGVLVAWARVYLGVHFPVDMLASALIAGICCGIAVLLNPPIQHWIMPIADGTYENALHVLRLPTRLFPRRKHPD